MHRTLRLQGDREVDSLNERHILAQILYQRIQLTGHRPHGAGQILLLALSGHAQAEIEHNGQLGQVESGQVVLRRLFAGFVVSKVVHVLKAVQEHLLVGGFEEAFGVVLQFADTRVWAFLLQTCKFCVETRIIHIKRAHFGPPNQSTQNIDILDFAFLTRTNRYDPH